MIIPPEKFVTFSFIFKQKYYRIGVYKELCNLCGKERMMTVDRKAEIIEAIMRILESANEEQLEFIYEFVRHHVKK